MNYLKDLLKGEYGDIKKKHKDLELKLKQEYFMIIFLIVMRKEKNIKSISLKMFSLVNIINHIQQRQKIYS